MPRERSTMSDMVALNYDIPPDLYRDFKIVAVKRGITVKALLLEVMQETVDKENQ